MHSKFRFPAVALTLLLASSSVAYATESIDNLNTQIEQSTSQKDKLKKDLEKVNEDMSLVEKKLTELTTKIETTNHNINKSELEIKTTKSKIKETKALIAEKEEELAIKKETLKKNLRALYANGEVSFLEVLFRSENLSNFLYRFDAIKEVANSHKSIYESIQQEQLALEEAKGKLETLKQQQLTAKAALEELKDEQIGQQNEHETLLGALEEKHAHIEEDIHAEESAIENMHAEIAQIIKAQEEKRRQEAEERQRAEELANQQAETAGQSASNVSDDITQEVGTGQFASPLPRGSYYISSGFGYRTHPVTKKKEVLHNGIDMAAPLNTPILAAASGTILYARPAVGFGHWVVIDHHNGFYTIYGHMYGNQIYVSEGQEVQQGDHIAGVGSDGTSTGNHLHFSVADGFNGNSFNYVNPMNHF